MSGGYCFLFRQASSVAPVPVTWAHRGRGVHYFVTPLLSRVITFALVLASLLVLALPAWAENGATTKGVPNVVPPKGEHAGKHVEQPIEFPHDIHTKVNGINCMYCHTYARRSKVAGIPPTSKCMGCHSMIATDKPRIKQLTEYWEKREPVKWKKVHDVPDFVHFTHEKHLKRFVFDNEGMSVDRVSEVCAFCHGDLKQMTVANKVKPLNMGFCVRCHEANKGPFDCWKCHK